MSQKRDSLNRLQIPKACPVDWEEMVGNDQRRFCNQCNKNVYNLSAMTRQQAEAVVAASRGRLCARFTRLPDGSILTREESYPAPTTLHQISRRTTPIAAAVLSAMIAVTPVVTVQARPSADHPAAITSSKTPNRANGQDTAAKISGTITDPSGAVIPNATLTLINDSSNETRTGQSGEEGTFQFENLTAGSYILKVESPGFKRGEVHGINVRAHQQQTVNVTMEIGATMGEVVSLPQSLRTLYKHSDRIVIATTGKSVRAKDESGNSLSVYKTELRVSSTLKGEHRPTIYLYRWNYSDDETTEFSPGNRLLLFLEKYDTGKSIKDAYRVVDTSERLEKLSETDLQVYKQRLAELAKIANAAKLNQQELVEWLVRCAENPATRFEGAYEFLRGAEQFADENEAEADSDEKEQKTEAPTDDFKDDDSSDSYKFLTARLRQSQKERLMNALFRSDQLGTRDAELIQLARIWKEPRLISFLIAQLHSVQYDPTPYVPQMMQMLAEMLNDDDELEALASEYEAIIKAQEDADDDEDDAEQKQPDKMEWKQQRSEAVKKFLAAVTPKLNKEEK